MSEDQPPTPNAQRPTSKGGAGRSNRYDLEERLLAYAVRIIRLVDALPRSRSGDHIGGQLMRAGTSPTLNHGEVEAAESVKDFIHKLKICLKELKESRRALLVIEGVPLTQDMTEVHALTDETSQLIRIFFASIRTAQRRLTSADESSVVREDALTSEGQSLWDIERWVTEVLREAIDEVEGSES